MPDRTHEAELVSFAEVIHDPLEHFRARIQVKMHRLGLPADALTLQAVCCGIASPVRGRLRGVRDKAMVSAAQLAIRRDPDGTYERLLQGEFPHLPAEVRSKLIDDAQRERREQLQYAEALEAKTERETEETQRGTAEELMIRARDRQLSRAQPDTAFRNRDISPEHHRMLPGYMDARDREDRAEARQAAALGLQRQEAQYREVKAQPGVLALTGELDAAGILSVAKKLPARAIDGALAKADAYRKAQLSEAAPRQSQAEQYLMTGLTTRSIWPGFVPRAARAARRRLPRP